MVEVAGAFSPDELPACSRDVDVAVMPSMWWDCAPLAAAECLAGRVPLLAPRLGGLAEAVRDEVDGLLFDGLDAGALAVAARPPGGRGRAARAPPGRHRARRARSRRYVDQLEAYYAGAPPAQGVAAVPRRRRPLGRRPRA